MLKSSIKKLVLRILHQRIASTSLKVDSQSQSHLLGQLHSRSTRYFGQNKNRSSGSISDENEYEILADGCEAHWEVVERILFVYSKLNSGQGYVQGMNEIIGPIYYTFATDSNLEWRGSMNIELSIAYMFLTCLEHAEADTFYCFNEFNDSYSR